jgi:hypothetical protein
MAPAQRCHKDDAAIGITLDRLVLGVATDMPRQRRPRCFQQSEFLGTTIVRGTGEFERYTPAKYVEMARAVMGSIDLDPAS